MAGIVLKKNLNSMPTSPIEDEIMGQDMFIPLVQQASQTGIKLPLKNIPIEQSRFNAGCNRSIWN